MMKNALAEKLRKHSEQAAALAALVEEAADREDRRINLACKMIPDLRFGLSTITSAGLALQLDFFSKEFERASAELAANREGRNVRPTVIRRSVVRRR
jgi:hypothetical protein